MSIRIKKWRWQLFVMGVLCVLIFPPVYRNYTKRISNDRITHEEVLGCWIQNKNSKLADPEGPNSTRSFAIFDSDGMYYVGIECSDFSCQEAYTGNWYYSDKRNYFFKLIPWGYQAWMRLNISHQAGPQFYFKKQNGVIQMYRGDYRAAISEVEFTKSNGLEIESLKKLVLSGSGMNPQANQ